MLRIIWNLWIYSIISQFFLVFALSARSENNDAEAILEKAIRDFRARIVANQRNESHESVDPSQEVSIQHPTRADGRFWGVPELSDSSDGEAINFVVHANENFDETQKRAKFEFLPHFEKEFYEFMVPEGLNREDFLVAIVDFIGLSKTGIPHFRIDSDPMGLFVAGIANTVQRPDHIQSQIPILLKKGAFVDSSKVPNNIYIFKITAIQHNHITTANMRAEIMRFMKRIDPIANETTAIDIPHIESENSIEEVWSSTVKAEEPSKHAMTTFTVNEPEKESLIVTRSVTEEDEFKSTANLELNAQDDMNIVTNDRDVNKTTIISANVTGNIGTENDLFIRTKSKGSSDSGIHLRGLIKHENESNMKILKAMEETGIPKEFVDEMTLIDPVLALETLEGLKTNETELMDPMDEPLKDSEFIAALEEANSKEGTSSMPDITVSIPIEFDTAITVEPNYKNSGELSKLESEGLENKEKAGKNITVHGNVSRPHVDDPQEGAAAPHDLASPLANGMPAETLIDNIQVVENSARLNVESNSGPGLDQDLNQNENVQNLMSDEPKSVEWSTAEPIEFLQDQAPENFSSHGIKIELTQQNNGPIQIPPYAEPGQSIDGIFAKIVAASNFTANEMFESQINPPGILDVRPHFAYPGQKMEIIVLEPTVFQRSTAAGRSLKFTLECTYANHDLRAQLPTGIVARRAFDAVQAAVAVGNTVTVGGGGGQFDAKRYTFHVSENAQNNAKIGKILVIGYSENKTENIQYGLLGNGAQHFKIDENGEITVTCQQAMICLDSETAPEYSITAVAKENASTITVPVTIHVDDLNDNLPKLKVFEKEIHVVDNEIEEPYFIMINDADISFQNRRNALELDGSASEFLVADHVVERDLHDAGASDGKHERIASYSPLWQIKIAAAAEPGVYTLVVRARQKDATITINNSSETTVNTSEATDNIVTAREDNAEITVIVKGESKKIRFGKTVYERTITSERLNKGNPLVQLDLKEAPENGGTVSFVILDRNPGWLAIESYGGHVYVGDVPRQSIKDGTYIATVGVLDQDTKKILAKCQVSITVIGTRQNEFILHKSLYSIVSARDGGLQTFAIPEILPENSALKIVEDTVRVYDSNSRRVRATENFVVMINNRNEVVLRAVDTIHEADFLHNVEQIVFQIQNVENERDKALVSIALSARVHDVVRRLHELSRPKFAAPWIDEATLIKIRLPEELPENYLVLRLPAYNPFNGRVIENFTLAGESAKYFRVDSVTASIKIHRRIDFEALSPAEQKSLSFELRAHNSAQDEAIFAEYDAVDDFNNSKDTSGTLARIDMQIFDVDDASPRIKVIELTDDENHTQIGNTPANRTQAGNTVANLIQISEGVRPGHMLARLSAHDADSQARKLKFALTSGSPTALKNFRIQQSNDTFYEITVSNEAKLDRETENCFELVASCMDPAGNRDQVPFVVELLDENDNRPLFTVQSLDVNVIDNWPRDVALMRFEAHDRDAGENARVSYSLLVEDKAAENFFAIDETTGVLRTARTLTELASEHDYALSVLASDNGVAPHFFSSTRVLVHVHDATRAADFEDAELRFVQPAISFVLELQEDTPIGRNVLKMEAIIGKMAQKNLMPVNYSIKPLNSSSDSTEWFRVDETTGELYTAAALDYERHKMITLEMVARRANASNVEARQLLRVRILNVDDHLPYFLQSSTEVSTLTFIWDDLANRDTIIGQVFAVDEDDTPFNDIYYYLLPSNPQAKKTFEIDEKSGEIRSIRGNDAIVGISPSAFHLYVFASSIKIADEKNLPHFNATRYDHLAVDVVAVSEKRRAHLTTRANLARLLENDTVVAVERSLKSQRIPITVYDAMRNSPFVYLLEDVEFIPWRNLNEFPSEDFIGIDASIGALRVDPLIAHSHLEGAFVATVRVQHAQSEITVAKIRKQVHILARESQLRFIIDEPAMVFALKMAAFKSNFESAISKNSPAKKFVAQLLAPEPHARLMNRSSVCFYFLNETTSNIADVFVPSSVSFQQLSIAENRELNRIYQLFRIVNVENCTSIADDVTSSNAIGAASTVTDDISHELLFWICALGFGILFLMTLCGYGIFIVRYREHLREKLAAEFDAPNKKIVEVQTCPIDVADYYCDGRFSTFFAPHLYDKQ